MVLGFFFIDSNVLSNITPFITQKTPPFFKYPPFSFISSEAQHILIQIWHNNCLIKSKFKQEFSILGGPFMKQSIAIMVILLPLQVFAMDPITDDEMNTITGAVGVHIYVEGEVTTPTYQVLQWKKHRNLRERTQSVQELNQKHSDIYEISYDDCELRFDTGKSENNFWINGNNANRKNRSLLKIGNPTAAPEISTENIHLSFKELSVRISSAPESIQIIPR